MVLCALPLKSELLPIRTYTAADGLPSDKVFGIVSDSRGFLWFCTPEGLSRFDGYRFVTFGVDEGLPHALVTGLVETRSGDRWIGTPRGLSRIAGSGGSPRFTNYKLGPEVAANYIRVLLASRSGKIWTVTNADFFEGDDSPNFQRREFRGLQAKEVTDMAEDPGGDFWIGTFSGIHLYGADRVRKQSFAQENGLPGHFVNMLTFDSRGRLWAAMRGGLALIARNGKGEWRVERSFSADSRLAGTDVKAILEASDGTFWVATQLGISKMSWGAGDQPVIQNLTREQGLSDRQINSLAEDQAGNIWAGTESAGVMRIDRRGFTTYREQDGLRTDRVFAVLEDGAGEVLAVTLAEGSQARSIDVFNGTRFQSVVPKVFNGYATWGWDKVLLQGRTGEWWAATRKGLCSYPKMNAADLDGRNPQACYREEDQVFRIFEDSRGGIWASSQSKQGDQLMRWDPRTKEVVTFPIPRIPNEPASDLVSAFAEDRQGNVWMGLYRGGLYRYDSRGFKLFKPGGGLPGGSVYALFADEGGLWIGSNGGGLSRVENPTDEHLRIQTYNTSRGMASNIVFCIASDLQGRIYAGTGKGLDRLNPKTGHIRHFSFANGLAHGEFRSAVRDRSGSLWFATTQGLSRLVPEKDRPPVSPRVFITDLQTGGGPHPVSQLGETRVSRIVLNPSQNQLQVEFAGLDYEPGEVLRYSYKLEGADTDWSPPRSQRTVNYAALAGGNHRFLVKAVTSEGVESASPAEIDFTVLPPLWRRWWFQGLALALVVALVLAAHRYRVQQMVNLERIRTAIATDLHDDIGASLSQIAILSEVARVGGNGHTHNGDSLERVATLARELVDSMSDIVWSIRSEPHALDSLVRRMREFALDLLATQGIEFEFATPPEGDKAPLSLQARRELFLMFKECIHNVVRHAGCTRVRAELRIAGREIVLAVEDNGRGLNPVERPPGSTGGIGIPGMRRRAESLGGRMDLTSQTGQGCSVIIRIPARRGALSRAIG